MTEFIRAGPDSATWCGQQLPITRSDLCPCPLSDLVVRCQTHCMSRLQRDFWEVYPGPQGQFWQHWAQDTSGMFLHECMCGLEKSQNPFRCGCSTPASMLLAFMDACQCSSGNNGSERQCCMLTHMRLQLALMAVDVVDSARWAGRETS
jgi:hypothetical protein